MDADALIFNKKYKIVYVDDDANMIDLVRTILEQHHFTVFTAIDGKNGLQLINQIEPDLILLDLMIPDMDGWEIYQHIRNNENLLHTPVIIITAKSEEIDQVLGLHIAKVDDYICKPVHPKELVGRINKVLSA